MRANSPSDVRFVLFLSTISFTKLMVKGRNNEVQILISPTYLAIR